MNAEKTKWMHTKLQLQQKAVLNLPENIFFNKKKNDEICLIYHYLTNTLQFMIITGLMVGLLWRVFCTASLLLQPRDSLFLHSTLLCEMVYRILFLKFNNKHQSESN